MRHFHYISLCEKMSEKHLLYNMYVIKWGNTAVNHDIMLGSFLPRSPCWHWVAHESNHRISRHSWQTGRKFAQSGDTRLPGVFAPPPNPASPRRKKQLYWLRETSDSRHFLYRDRGEALAASEWVSGVSENILKRPSFEINCVSGSKLS